MTATRANNSFLVYKFTAEVALFLGFVLHEEQLINQRKNGEQSSKNPPFDRWLSTLLRMLIALSQVALYVVPIQINLYGRQNFDR
jgi:hypothetical protein